MMNVRLSYEGLVNVSQEVRYVRTYSMSARAWRNRYDHCIVNSVWGVLGMKAASMMNTVCCSPANTNSFRQTSCSLTRVVRFHVRFPGREAVVPAPLVVCFLARAALCLKYFVR